MAASLIQRDFSAKNPDQLRTSDITYIPTLEGWPYLAVFLDAYSRHIVGWPMSQRAGDELIGSAFRQARINRRSLVGPIVHSDRGNQYCSRSFKELLDANRYRQSMSSTGNCYDSAIIKGFLAALKTELIHDKRYRSLDEGRRSIFQYIEMSYNRGQIYFALGGLSPKEDDKMNCFAYLRVHFWGERQSEEPETERSYPQRPSWTGQTF